MVDYSSTMLAELEDLDSRSAKPEIERDVIRLARGSEESWSWDSSLFLNQSHLAFNQ